MEWLFYGVVFDFFGGYTILYMAVYAHYADVTKPEERASR